MKIPCVDNHKNVDLIGVSKTIFGKFLLSFYPITGSYPYNEKKLFKTWGYTVDDAKWLQSKMERQARKKYIFGECQLGKLNNKGQRNSIKITISRRNNGTSVSFIIGWMVYPNGVIQLTTPYGDK